MLERRDNASARASCAPKAEERGPSASRPSGIPARLHQVRSLTQSTSFLMTSEVFNANPTIVATTAPTARRRAAHARHSLWLSDDEDSDIHDSDDEPEPIDADEIFGLFFYFFHALCPKLSFFLKILFVPSATRSTARCH